MKVHFYKYQGTGNDFVMIDNRSLKLSLTVDQISAICDRRFGIGADGLILIQDHPTLDFEMVYYNSDGSQSMCGNGSRCAVMFAWFLNIINSSTTFQSTDGIHKAAISEDSVALEMHDTLPIQERLAGLFLNTGSPHHLEFVEQVDSTEVFDRGQSIRQDPEYAPEGTNVNFIEIVDEHTIKVRTYERGVEDETLSCGTGVTAASIAATKKNIQSPVTVYTQGGQLIVSFKETADGFTDVKLIGPAKMVFEGDIII
ncbi:MAG: diaminopimelate epimerase [Cyclobacteriaceae bacterium]